MLVALKVHLGHDQPNEVLVRAAVMMIRFPDLVDELLSAPEPPEFDRGMSDGESRWERRDVREVVLGCSAQDLAICFGRIFPDGASPSSGAVSPGSL
jgi:hypothetical protein